MLYQYRCPTHGIFESYEELFNPSPMVRCLTCGKLSVKIFSTPQIRFVGTGWTIKDKSHEFEQRFPSLAKSASRGE